MNSLEHSKRLIREPDARERHGENYDRALAEVLSEDAEPECTYLTCPFCDEGDFDLIGLKTHLTRTPCDEFASLEIPPA